MADVTAAQRKMFAKMKIAMPDGTYYVRNADDLSNAIQTVGRSETAGKSGDAIRKHIMARATALKLQAKIPPTWNPDGSLKHMTADEFIEHFGRKGMKWGEHIYSKDGKTFVKEGTSEDAAKAGHIGLKAKTAGGAHVLSNEELKTLTERMNLEQNYSRLSASDVKKGQGFVKKYNGHANTALTALDTTKKVIKVVGPIVVAAAAAAAAAKAGSGNTGPIRMPQLAIGA